MYIDMLNTMDGWLLLYVSFRWLAHSTEASESGCHSGQGRTVWRWMIIQTYISSPVQCGVLYCTVVVCACVCWCVRVFVQASTVKPLYWGHLCPVYRGAPNAEVDLNIAQYGGDCRVSSLERCPLFRVSFKQRFHCSSYLLWDAACTQLCSTWMD